MLLQVVDHPSFEKRNFLKQLYIRPIIKLFNQVFMEFKYQLTNNY